MSILYSNNIVLVVVFGLSLSVKTSINLEYIKLTIDYCIVLHYLPKFSFKTAL